MKALPIVPSPLQGGEDVRNLRQWFNSLRACVATLAQSAGGDRQDKGLAREFNAPKARKAHSFKEWQYDANNGITGIVLNGGLAWIHSAIYEAVSSDTWTFYDYFAAQTGQTMDDDIVLSLSEGNNIIYAEITFNPPPYLDIDKLEFKVGAMPASAENILRVKRCTCTITGGDDNGTLIDHGEGEMHFFAWSFGRILRNATLSGDLVNGYTLSREYIPNMYLGPVMAGNAKQTD
jgi:hypothetical protein